MYRAISTRYFGPTNSRGSRIKAVARKREHDMPEISLTDSWNHTGSVEDNRARVAKLLVVKMGYSGLYVGGGTDDGYVFVNAGEEPDYRPLGQEDRDWFFVAEAR